MAILKFRSIHPLEGYEGPFSELITKWKSLFTTVYESYTTLVKCLPKESSFTSLVRTWEDNHQTILSKGTTDYNDLDDNLNDFLSGAFNVHLCVIKDWCGANSEHPNCLITSQNLSACTSCLRKIPQYFLTHEFNAIIASFRNEQDYCPVDFLLDGNGHPYDLADFLERFTESRLATFYLTAYLTVKYSNNPIIEWKEEIFDSFFSTEGKSLISHTHSVSGHTFPTIVFATDMAKEHLKKVCSSLLKLNIISFTYFGHIFLGIYELYGK